MRQTFMILLTLVLGLLLFSCGNKPTQSDDQIAAPVISPAGGTYNEPVDILISCATPGAIIHYTVDGSIPSNDSPVYTGLLHLGANTTLKAKAFKSGWISSTVNTAMFQFKYVETPIISPAGGVFTSPQMVTISCSTADAVIRYTVNGVDPNETSLLYTSPIPVNSSITIKSRAYLPDLAPSGIVAATFTMQLQPPTFSPAGGYYPYSQTVSITHPYNLAQIWFTLDGSEPTTASTLYTHPISVASNTVIKAKAIYGNWDDSEIVSSFYIINLPDQMSYVSGGTFNNATSNVTLSPYYIGKREVTELEWYLLMPNTSGEPIESEKPITEINWSSAVEYCNWRSITEGFQPCYNYDNTGVTPAMWPSDWNSVENHALMACDWSANGYRLPTEMEWMFAARSGTQSYDYIYSGSNIVDDVAWFNGNTTELQVVGTKQANGLGLYDMSGNLWEYCWDIYYFKYPSSDVSNPTGPSSGIYRVMRGGSFANDASNCTVARRFYTYSSLLTNFSGFRVARSVN